MKEETYVVTLVRPRGVTVAEMRAYIEEAVGTWGGSYRPPMAYGEGDDGDPLFGGVECNVRKGS